MRTDSQVRMRSWYIRNADENREKRNAEYRNDPKLRELKITRAKNYREKRKAGAKVERVYYREYRGEEIQVYSLGHIADRAGTYTQMLVNFEKRGWIPKPVFDEKHRLYTARQVRLVTSAVEEYNRLSESKDINRKALDFLMKDHCEKLNKKWS